MKANVGILSFVAATCVVSISYAQAPQVPPGVKSSFETPEAKVLKVYSLKDGDHKFIAYVVKWKDAEVIVSDPLARSEYKVGDTIRFMAHKTHIEKSNPEVYSLSFTLLDVPRLPAPKPTEETAVGN